MRPPLLCGIVLSLTLFSCATARIATPSGSPEIAVRGSNKDAVKACFLKKLLPMGYSLMSETENGIVMTRQLTGGSAFAYTLLMGNAYSSTPECRLNISFVGDGVVTRVYGRVFVCIQNAFGRQDTQDVSGGKPGQELQSIFVSIKDEIEAEGRPTELYLKPKFHP
jgi:hypothetical protein